MADSDTDRSYRALLGVPGLPRILLGMTLARTAGAMVSVAIVLFTLVHYGSPALAGAVTFAQTAPGLIVSPVAGALLDRHNRARLVILDYLVGASCLALIAGLAMADRLPAWLLVLIAAISSLTTPLSNSGLRSLFPVIVPRHLWERANAIDSNGYVVATLIGPPLAGVMVQVYGGPVSLLAVAVLLALAAIVTIGIREPPMVTSSTGRLFRDAWNGLVYTWRNPTLRALGLSISSINLGSGVMTIVIPIIIVTHLGQGPAIVGIAYAMMGLAGMVAATVFGRMDSRGRERRWLALSMVGMAAGTAVLLPEPPLVLVFVAMAIAGLMNGPLDIALFTLRQRRTDPAWMGRAFAVSMAFNFAGFPVGSAISGALVGLSVQAAVGFGVAACLLGGVIAWRMLPVESRAPAEVAARPH